MSSTGAKMYHKLQSGKFTSIVYHDERVYAAAYHASQVWVFAINNNAGFKLVLLERVVVPEGWTTLSVKCNLILFCNRDVGEIYMLSHNYMNTGEEPRIPCMPLQAPQGAAARCEPYISDDDDDTTVMICDRRHNRILLFSFLQLARPLVVDVSASCVAALKDRKTNFLFVVHSSPDVLTIHNGVPKPAGRLY